ncbi:DUF397 domain-containing protein [Streptomyces caatingaensis]|uniref:DUF397 domain-containing protein n=1 Tax=Streptomyces caatingaensis TaxID=1678637 RepID=UPI00099D7165|nr:DUF397 domain-containing protein [Streptomyces caatingaensis]
MNNSPWIRSSYSTGSGNNCLELRPRPHVVHVRDSKLGVSLRLSFGTTTWADFVTSLSDT